VANLSNAMIHDESGITNLDPASSCPICSIVLQFNLGVSSHKLIKLAKAKKIELIFSHYKTN